MWYLYWLHLDCIYQCYYHCYNISMWLSFAFLIGWLRALYWWFSSDILCVLGPNHFSFSFSSLFHILTFVLHDPSRVFSFHDICDAIYFAIMDRITCPLLITMAFIRRFYTSLYVEYLWSLSLRARSCLGQPSPYPVARQFWATAFSFDLLMFS